VSRRRRLRQQRARRAHAPGGLPRLVILAGLTLVATLIVLLIVLRNAAPPVDPVRDGSPAWSPDGTRIAFYSERDGNGEIYVMDADGSNVTRLTNTLADEGYPWWSPDGSTLTFDSDEAGGFDIWAMHADGTSPRRLTTHAAREVAASWSPDGGTIVFMSDRDGGFDVYAMNPDGSGVRRLTQAGTAWFPVFSADGARLAFHVGRDVHVMPAAGGEPIRLTHDPANGMHPSWSPDGARIAFMSWRNGRTEIFVMNADGSDAHVVATFDDGDAIDPRWAPNGDRIAFVRVPGGMSAGGPRSIWVVNADGTGLMQLTGR
jgi:TolB protein